MVPVSNLFLYMCWKVLPPLRDVKNRPEVGSALRNKLVRLMTHTDTDVKNCAAEFLFILCKESGKGLSLYRQIYKVLHRTPQNCTPNPPKTIALGEQEVIVTIFK